MAIVNVKEIYKEFNLAKKHFKKGVELAKKNIAVGEIYFAGSVRKDSAKKAKVTLRKEPTNDSILPDLDKGGYMSKRDPK